MAAIMSAMRSGIKAYVTGAVATLDDWPAMTDRLRAEHRGVFSAVQRGDGSAAAVAAAAHITGFYLDAGVG